MGRLGALVGLLAAIRLLMPGDAFGQLPSDEDGPILFTADQLTHNRELGIVTASGNVEISRNDRTLLADMVTYNQRENLVTASGNISLLEPGGDVLFASFMELTGDFKDGIVKDIRILLSDTSRIAASGARRSDGKVLEFRNAVYSPCRSCATRPTRPPLWQVKALRVVHDKPSQTIEYNDAWMEFMGVPVAYTPYFSHPDPTVKRKTGFLAPTIGSSSSLGQVLTTPYFVAAAPHRDFTITPTFTTKENVLLEGQYRERFVKGQTQTNASLTYDSDDKVRGHINSESRFDIDDTWRAGLDVKRATDDTYLRRYRLPSERTYTSQAFAEGFRHRNYARVRAMAFQGMSATDDPGQSPIVLPMMEFRHVGEPTTAGAYTTLDSSLLALTRTDGTDTRRFSLGGGWHLPFSSPLGDLYELEMSVRGDMYHVSNLDQPASTQEYSGLAGRVYPQINVNWRYPWSRRDGTVNQVLEPVAALSVSPYGGNPSEIPNEDSVDVEFDDTNLLADSRFAGIDRVDGGPRISYGMRWGVYGDGGGATSVFVGQSYRYRDDSTYSTGSGLEDNLSDIVTRVGVVPAPHLNLDYRARFDKDDFSPRRNEFSVSAGPPSLRVSTQYTFFDADSGSAYPGREELVAGGSAEISRHWGASFSSRYDMVADDPRSMSFALKYDCECFTFTATLTRRFYEDQDLQPEDAIFFRLYFKTLGDIGTGLTASGG